jgi:hypothetical protein
MSPSIAGSGGYVRMQLARRLPMMGNAQGRTNPRRHRRLEHLGIVARVPSESALKWFRNTQ